MRVALALARDAAQNGEAPVGAVIFHRGQLIAKGGNQREMLNDPTAHAEMIAITAAAAALGSWRLDECELYVTLEPCAMCAGAVVLARVPRVIFGAADPKAGAGGSVLDVLNCEKLNHRAEVVGGVLAEECGAVLRDFFQARRQTKPTKIIESGLIK
jgi:tRNA(adenine34) deaminase